MKVDTPTSIMNSLVRYINDDGAVIAHVKRETGRTVTVADVKRARRLMHRPLVHDYEPLGTDENSRWKRQARLSDSRMQDRLAKVAAR